MLENWVIIIVFVVFFKKNTLTKVSMCESKQNVTKLYEPEFHIEMQGYQKVEIGTV